MRRDLGTIMQCRWTQVPTDLGLRTTLLELPIMSEPEVTLETPKPVEEKKSPVGTYAGWIALLAAVGGLFYYTTPKPTIPDPIIIAPKVEIQPTPAQVEATTSKDAADVAETESQKIPVDKNTICNQECKKLKYDFGAFGKDACHCWQEL